MPQRPDPCAAFRPTQPGDDNRLAADLPILDKGSILFPVCRHEDASHNSFEVPSRVLAQSVGDREMTITKDMPIGEIVQDYPQTVRVFLSHGLMCIGCAAAHFENLEQGARAHGLYVEALVKDLNAAV